MLSRDSLLLDSSRTPYFIQPSTQVRDLFMEKFQGNHPFTIHPSHTHEDNHQVVHFLERSMSVFVTYRRDLYIEFR